MTIRRALPAMNNLPRRRMLQGAGLSALALGSPTLLSACGTESQVQTEDSCKSTDKSEEEKELVFSNWPEYIDVQGKRMPTLEQFETETGIDVTYDTDINDNADFFGKVKDQLGSCEPIGRDIITMTDSTAGRMIALGWMQQLDKDNLPNVEANLIESLRSPSWDSEREYSVPWQAGLTGIAYNADVADEVTSFEEMLTRSDLKGKVGLLTEMEDTMAFMLVINGADPEDFSDDEWGTAIDHLTEVVGSGQVRRFTGNDYIRDLKSGNLAACMAWSGDIAAAEDDRIPFVQPEEGLNIWSDNMMVPNKADHKANAEALMNYYYDPVVAATLAAWVWYICPVDGAREAMEKIDPSLVDNNLIFPSEDFLGSTRSFMALDEKTRQQYETDFRQASGA
ncbi:spermidine/putrescine ABC transporter substrate-binding protein [Nocardioides sp. HM23]|uniref:polyamine ABC transporter substrate-binding protein n=1 Tax=Nocardioides bizhenqiangii TaxID=3095076 RepID=UPI002ACA9FE8|nr:spermidine/putrescine ABC transporter substrate-binding protein [Nocardioides sp. HM23]MDZ5619657.1 spermidine/putrescine ABC transporter substrate-binding protein [Nocardioides sp. HM23]